MDALILSCSTGGGHNQAGYAVKEELEHRGHRVTMLDPYELVGKNVDQMVGNGYIRIAQRVPHLFGVLYMLGDGYRRLPIHSPVYAVNMAMLNKMRQYLQTHTYDVILFPHLYPGEILTYMKSKGISVPKTIFIATDYVCIPFTEEIDCDYYVTPAKELNHDFIRRGIPEEKLISVGIPTKQAFLSPMKKEEAIAQLGLDSRKRYLLLSGGSIGAGKIQQTIGILSQYLQTHTDFHLIVICGNNQRLLEIVKRAYGDNPQITLLSKTDKMALYMRACDAFLSKPGGLSSTEAAVSGVPLIHISPIPGCENRNMAFFEQCGMSIAVGNHLERLPQALVRLQNPDFVALMVENQKAHSNPFAAAQICDLAERICK